MMALPGSLGRDVRIAIRERTEIANPASFFLLAVVVYSIGTGFSMYATPIIGVGAVWVLILFATLLGAEGMFRRDYADGTLEVFLLHAGPLPICILVRVLAHWGLSVLPLVLLSPIAAWMMGIPPKFLLPMFVSLMLGTPALVLLSAIGSALVLGLNRGSTLLALLILPLHVPVLILGLSLATAESSGGGFVGLLLWLIALLSATMTLAPFAIALALKASVEY